MSAAFDPNSSKRNNWRASFSTAKGKEEKPTGTNIRDIEKIVGFVSDEYKCVYNNFEGILYAGPLALVWLGRIFFLEWTVVIKWEDVAHVKKRENAIRVEVNNPKPTFYEFDQVFNLDKVWSSLVSLHNETILDVHQPRGGPTPRQVSRGMRRTNSDPLRMSVYFQFDAPTTATLLQEEKNSSDEAPPLTANTRSLSAPVGEKISRDSIRLESTTISEVIKVETLEETISAPEKPSLEKRWSEIVEDTHNFTTAAVENHELPCNLETFFSLFLDNDAKYSVPNFMRESGDEELNCSDWETSDDGETKFRTIEYTHPVNAPMAPPKAQARKEQTVRRFGEHGLVLETKTFVSDVPMTDCFYVADQIQVVPLGDDKVTVRMAFDIRFVKSTMFKSIISRTTTGEFEGFMNRLAIFMSKSLGEKIEEPSITIPVEAPVPQPSVFSALAPNATIALLLLVLLLQGWLLMDVRRMKSEVNELRVMYKISLAEQCAQSVGTDTSPDEMLS